MQSETLVFDHKASGLDYIEAFAKALKPFGLFIEDVTPDNAETLEIVIVDTKPEKEWES